MTRFGLVLSAGAVVVLSMGGCGASPRVPQWMEPQPSSAVTVPHARPLVSESPESPEIEAPPIAAAEPSESATPPAPRAGFLEAVRGRLPEATMDLRNEEITEMGGRACDSLTAGNPRREVVTTLNEFGLTEPDARELVTLARSYLCNY